MELGFDYNDPHVQKKNRQNVFKAYIRQCPCDKIAHLSNYKPHGKSEFFINGMPSFLQSMSLWRNRPARSAVNREVGGSSPPRDVIWKFLWSSSFIHSATGSWPIIKAFFLQPVCTA